MIHVWDDAGKTRQDPITTEAPPGHRECKALRSWKAQDFLLCLYWFTGPGGGRVDGVLFDLKRRTLGEFFSAAINTQLLSTLCYPKTAAGPMPSVAVVDWSTSDATAQRGARIRVTVSREGWSTKEAEAVRAFPGTQRFCECLGGEDCPGEPTVPMATKTVIYELTDGQLHPAAESRQVLEEIAGQWGHHADLEAWNLAMRGF